MAARKRAPVTKGDGYLWREMFKFFPELEQLGRKHNRQCRCLTLDCLKFRVNEAFKNIYFNVLFVPGSSLYPVLYGHEFAYVHDERRRVAQSVFKQVAFLRKKCNKKEKTQKKYVRKIVDEVALVLPERHLPELVAELLVGYYIDDPQEKPVRPIRKCRRVE